MIRLIPAPAFRFKVPISVPGAEENAVIEFEFRHKGLHEFAHWWEAAHERPAIKALPDLIVSWNGPVDDDGKEVPYSVEALAKVLDNYPKSGAEIICAYVAELAVIRSKR